MAQSAHYADAVASLNEALTLDPALPQARVALDWVQARQSRPPNVDAETTQPFRPVPELPAVR